MFSKGKKKTEEIFGPDPLHINDLPLKTVPDYMRKRGGIWYWTGALISMAFVYQVVTGLFLLLYYNPSSAYTTTEYVVNSVPYGSLILTTHLYGAYAMIVLVYVHMYRNYFMGAYKKPRQIQWITGVLLLAITIGVGYFGYSMTGDVLSIDATDVGRGIALSTPVLGNALESILFGDGTSTGLFIRMLGWHIILAALIGLIFGLHFYLAEANGIMPSHRESKYKAPAMDKEKPEYKPWNPYNMAFMTQLALFSFGLIILIPSIIAVLPNVPALFSPFPQVSPSSPLAAYVPPYPPWFLLFIYKAVDFEMFSPFGGISALVASAVFGVIPLLYFVLIPFIDRSKDLHPLARPVVTAFGILGIIYMAILSLWGALTPGLQIPNSEVAAVLVPPFVVVVGGMLIMSRLYKKGKFKISATKVMGSFLVFLFILIFAIFSFAQNFAAFLSNTSGMNLLTTLFTGGTTVFAAFGTMKSADYSKNLEVKQKKPIKNHVMSKNSAMVITAILTVISIAIMYLIWGLNSTNVTQESAFGIGLGIVFILAGIVLRVYRAAFYNE